MAEKSKLYEAMFIVDSAKARENYQQMEEICLSIITRNGGEVVNMDEFLALNPLMKELKAVQTGSVWCTRESMYQQTLNIGRMINELNIIFNAGADDDPELVYFFRLK